jgi:hypothetical protein
LKTHYTLENQTFFFLVIDISFLCSFFPFEGLDLEIFFVVEFW